MEVTEDLEESRELRYGCTQNFGKFEYHARVMGTLNEQLGGCTESFDVDASIVLRRRADSFINIMVVSEPNRLGT